MKKRAHLYVIAAAPAPTNVIPIEAGYAPRERSWRDLLRRLEKNPPAAAVVVPTTLAGHARRHRTIFATGITGDHPPETDRK